MRTPASFPQIGAMDATQPPMQHASRVNANLRPDHDGSRRTSRVVFVCLSVALGVALLVSWQRPPTPSTPSGDRIAAPAIDQSAEPVGEAVPNGVVDSSPLAELRKTASTAMAVVEVSPDEPALMDLLRRVRDLESRIRLARDGNRRFPNTPDASERTAILIHALAELGRSSEARGEAEAMVNGAPDSEWVREIEQFTGAKRHRNVRVNDTGELEYYE